MKTISLPLAATLVLPVVVSLPAGHQISDGSVHAVPFNPAVAVEMIDSRDIDKHGHVHKDPTYYPRWQAANAQKARNQAAVQKAAVHNAKATAAKAHATAQAQANARAHRRHQSRRHQKETNPPTPITHAQPLEPTQIPQIPNPTS
jgi:hypothetical protein